MQSESKFLRTPKSAAVITTLVGLSFGMAGPETRGAIMLDGTTRAQMTADNPTLDGFFASASTSVGGEQGVNNSSLTHLWGPYYAIAAHEDRDGLSIGSIYTGRNYRTSAGAPIAINNITLSAQSDFGIVTAAVADNTPRDLNSKLVGVAVAVTSNSTIYDSLSAPANLALINQVTGSNITIEQILAGQSIIAAPALGEHIWSEGYGAWGTPSTPVQNPDGDPGQWQGLYFPNGGGLNGTYGDPTLYFASSFVNDGGLTNGPLNGVGKSIDSGSVAIINVPEPTLLAAVAFTGAALLRRRRNGTGAA